MTVAGQMVFGFCTENRGGRELAERVETFAQSAPAAGENRRIAQGEVTRLRLAQFLKQIDHISRLVSLKNDDKVLIVEAKRVGCMQLNRTVLRTDAQVLFQHFLSLLLWPRVPFAGALHRTNEKVIGLAGDDVRMALRG